MEKPVVFGEKSGNGGPKTGLRGPFFAFLVGVFVFLAVLFAVGRLKGERGEPLIEPGKRVASTLSFVRMEAEKGKWRMEEEKGKVVVVNYFATWCGPCVAEMPELVAIEKEYRGKGVVFVGVSMDQEGEYAGKGRDAVVKEFVKRQGMEFEVVVPEPESMVWRGEMPIPQTYLYDKMGRMAKKTVGMVSGGEVKGDLEKLLGE